MESALLLRCPAAEPAVAASRARLDLAARVGVPAHVTVTYPFRPPGHRSPRTTTDGSSGRCAARSVVHVDRDGHGVVRGRRSSSSSWPSGAAVVDLIEAVTEAFPELPPYAGAFTDVVPHLTVGHDHDVETLRAAEDTVRARLPFTQVVTEVELWSGPSLSSGRRTLAASAPTRS